MVEMENKIDVEKRIAEVKDKLSRLMEIRKTLFFKKNVVSNQSRKREFESACEILDTICSESQKLLDISHRESEGI